MDSKKETNSNPSLEIEGVGTAICSVECLQDIEIQMRMFRQFRTTEITDDELAAWKLVCFGVPPTKPEETVSPEVRTWREILGCGGIAHRCPILTGEITETEIAEWTSANEQLGKMNLEEIRKKYKIKFESEDEEPDLDWEGPLWDSPEVSDKIVNFFTSVINGLNR